MKYQKEVLLKDGTKCLLRGAGERDAAEILRCFHLTHAETDYLLTYRRKICLPRRRGKVPEGERGKRERHRNRCVCGREGRRKRRNRTARR